MRLVRFQRDRTDNTAKVTRVYHDNTLTYLALVNAAHTQQQLTRQTQGTGLCRCQDLLDRVIDVGLVHVGFSELLVLGVRR